jgi:RNA polymerase sigma-70 factor (ECF subfamily)
MMHVSARDDDAFARLVEPHRAAIRIHCYRMLGSSSDSEDLVQETMLRAWRSRAGLREASLARPWLYRIATNACLDELARRPRRAMPSDVVAAADPAAPIAAVSHEPIWLEPMPDSWLFTGPGETYERRETVVLAFMAALHVLTPIQRAVLLLRDVAELSANDTAETLAISVSAANSALFRARDALRARPLPQELPVDSALLARYVRAFEQHDLHALVAVLHEDVRTTMPPSPTWIEGREANAEFYRRMFSSPPGAIKLVATGANGQPAFGFYRAATGDAHRLRAIHVITVVSQRVIAIDHFMSPSLGTAFGLGQTLPAS